MGHGMLEEGKNKEHNEKLQLKGMPNINQPLLPWKKVIIWSISTFMVAKPLKYNTVLLKQSDSAPLKSSDIQKKKNINKLSAL